MALGFAFLSEWCMNILDVEYGLETGKKKLISHKTLSSESVILK